MYIYNKRIYHLLFTVLDFIGRIVFFFLPTSRVDIPKRILFIRVDHIGDVINSTVVLNPIRKSFPDVKVDFMVAPWSAAIVMNHPEVDNVLQFTPPWFDRKLSGFSRNYRDIKLLANMIKEGNYDVCIDLRGDFRHILGMYLAGVMMRVGYGITGGGFMLTHEKIYEGIKHETVRNLDLLEYIGITGVENQIDLKFDPSLARKAEDLLVEKGVFGKFVVMHVVSGDIVKNWDKNNFANLAEIIKNDMNIEA